MLTLVPIHGEQKIRNTCTDKDVEKSAVQLSKDEFKQAAEDVKLSFSLVNKRAMAPNESEYSFGAVHPPPAGVEPTIQGDQSAR